MKYKIGDKVRIRKDLVVGRRYGNDGYVNTMDDIAKSHDYILTISDTCGGKYQMSESDIYNWTEEMVERLAELTDREKFESWMRELSSLSGSSKTWQAFNRCVAYCPDESGYEDNLKILSHYLFGEEKKKMTKAEIEAELGYEIEIMED